MTAKRALVTGGAGFIGSHLCEALADQGWTLTILDNMSAGHLSNIRPLFEAHPDKVSLLQGDCKKPEDIAKAMQDVDTVLHFAANPEVRLELNDPQTCFAENVQATHILLEELRKTKASHIVFASTSTVYGDAGVLPTPEEYSPLEPISVYGASKLAAEALIISYAHMFKKRAAILRLANIIGPRSRHGVIPDFLTKLEADPTHLKILGDGSQNKSYLYITDCIQAILTSLKEPIKPVEIFNIGSEDQIQVARMAHVILEEAGLRNTQLEFTGGVEGGRGWQGDVKNMLLDITKLKGRGWAPKYNSEAAVRRTVRSILRGEPR